MKYYKYITFIGLLTIVILQFLWYYNTYILFSGEVKNKVETLLVNAMFQETEYRSCKIPDGTSINAATNNAPEIPDITILEDGLFRITHSDVSLLRLDSILNRSLKSHGLNNTELLLIEMKTGHVIDRRKSYSPMEFVSIKSNIIPIRVNKSLGIQLVLLNPYNIIFEHLGLLMIASFLMTSLILYCIIKQIRIIIKQNNISQIRQDFSYAMIHDMKSPLSTIMSGIKNLQSEKLEEKPDVKRKSLRLMWEETDHLLMLINKVLTISKIEENKLIIYKTNILIEPMVKSIVEKYLSHTRKIMHFSYDFKTNFVFADGEYFKEVISNIIDNAIKYSKEKVEILISSNENENETMISVRDNGLGISDQDQKLIFEKFERASALGRTKKGGATGFGLGLNYVLQVMEAHGGRIVVESELNNYTEFILYIPKGKYVL